MNAKPYAIVQIYNIEGCQIYYGNAEQCLEILHNTKQRAYGRVFDTQDQMMDQLNYYKEEKPNAIIHNMDEKNAA